MSRRIIVHAPNVHLGGGLTLLKAVLETAGADELSLAILDERIRGKVRVADGVESRFFRPSLTGRLAAEFALRARATSSDTVLCFGALPPLFRLRARVAVLLQNRNVLGVNTLRQFGLRTGLRIAAERTWLRAFSANADEFLVQTRAMAALLSERIEARRIVVVPYSGSSEIVARSVNSASAASSAPQFDFVYVASGDAHKNHEKLILAWNILAAENIRPSLCLTLDVERYTSLWEWISRQAREHRLRIENKGELRHPEILELYRVSRALVFPSTSESLGLPLVEARRAGLPVIASELDYVRDVLDPEQSFDPGSEVSIARAVKRFLGRTEPPLQLIGAREFIARLLSAAT